MRPDPQETRFVGIQWRLSVAFLAVGLAGAGLTAGALGLALARGAPPASLWTAATTGALAGAALAAVLGLAVARWLKRRLREVGRFAAVLAAGNLAHRLAPDQWDEIGQLEEQLNDMAEHLSQAMGALREMGERNRQLAAEAGALAERTRLARDLHDTVNQELFSLSLQAATARRKLEALAAAAAAGGADLARDLPPLAAAAAELDAMARGAHAQIRELILQLRPPNLAQQGLAAALQEYVTAFGHRHGLACTCAARAPRLPLAVEEGLFRIAQEALNNVAKHAGATRAEVELAAGDGWLELTVRDNGRGFDPGAPARPTALGLVGMKERAAALGARVTVQSSPGAGTAVTVRLPLAPAGEGDAGA